MGTISGAVGTITGRLAQLLALYAEEEAIRRRLREDPPNDPLEYAKLLDEAAALADKVVKLLGEISSGVGKLSTDEIAQLNEATRVGNQTKWTSELPDTSGVAYWPKTQETGPERSKLKADDQVFKSADGSSPSGSLWTVWDPHEGRRGPQPPKWERVP
jgi:hypothetical protein